MAKQTINESEAGRLLGFIFEVKDQNKAREEAIKKLKARNNTISDVVDEYISNKKEIEEIASEMRESRKLIDTLISFSEKASGKDFVDDGPIFRNGGSLPEET